MEDADDDGSFELDPPQAASPTAAAPARRRRVTDRGMGR
jgi:hypothetical protein